MEAASFTTITSQNIPFLDHLSFLQNNKNHSNARSMIRNEAFFGGRRGAVGGVSYFKQKIA